MLSRGQEQARPPGRPRSSRRRARDIPRRAAALDGNVVGGGVATLSGGSDEATVTYSTGGGMAFHAQPGRAARFAGTQGDGPVVEYSAPADTNPGREAWLLGGGDNAEVVYTRPR